jgi:hypothetical protein
MASPRLRQQRRRRNDDDAETRPTATVDRVAIARAAWDLISKGAASIDEGELAPLHARVVSFWRGDGVLEIDAAGSLSRTRIPRKLGPEQEGVLLTYLAMHAGNS